MLMTPRRKIPTSVYVKPIKAKRPRLAEGGKNGHAHADDQDKAGGKGKSTAVQR